MEGAGDQDKGVVIGGPEDNVSGPVDLFGFSPFAITEYLKMQW